MPNEQEEVKQKKEAEIKKEKKPDKVDPNKKIKTKRFILKKFRLHASIGGYDIGTEITLECRKNGGQPRERYWRRRLRDAVKDGCIELIK